MDRDLTPLVDALREIAYDAGYALLYPVDAGATRRYADRYNGVCRQLRELDPCLAPACPALPEDATPGAVRIAARSVAAYALDPTLTGCPSLAA